MSSDVQSVLAQIQSNNYASFVIFVAVSYDYCLTFSKEVTYIWKRPWTRVSTLFLLIRYVGYLSAFTSGLAGTTFLQGPVKMYTKIGDIEGTITYVLSLWAYAIFWIAADMVMVLRVYAMYNRSRFILSILLLVYITEVVVLFVGASIYSDPNYATVSIFQVLDVTICAAMISTATWNNASVILPFILGTILCTLMVAHFVRESLQIYRVTKRWQLNRYTNLLVRDGLLYFFATFFNSLINLLGALGILPQEWVQPVLLSASTIVLYTLTPRFVINLRELYVRDTQGRLDRDIDTGFGLSSGVRRGVGGTTTFGTIAFVHGTSEDGEEMTTTAERAEGSSRQGSVV